MKTARQRIDRLALWQSVLRHSALWLVVMSLLAGCATSALNEGDRAAAHGQWDAAIAAYEQAVQQHPDDRVLALKLLEFKRRAAFVHLDRGEQLLSQQRREEALGEFRRALELYPTLDAARARMRELQQAMSTTPRASEGRVPFSPSPSPVAPNQATSSPVPNASTPGEGPGSLSATSVVPGGSTLPASKGQEPATQSELPSDGSLPLVTIQPQQLTAQVGEQLTVQVTVSNVTNLFGAPFYLEYDPARLEVVSAAEGGFLNNDGQSTVFLKSIDPVKGQVIVGVSRLGAVGGVSGSGSLVSITFKAKASGPVTLTFQNVDFRDARLSQIPVLLQSGHIQIEG